MVVSELALILFIFDDFAVRRHLLELGRAGGHRAFEVDRSLSIRVHLLVVVKHLTGAVVIAAPFFLEIKPNLIRHVILTLHLARQGSVKVASVGNVG